MINEKLNKDLIEQIESIQENIQNMQPVILYESATGTTGSITLSDTIENYKYIEIYVTNTGNGFLVPAQRFCTNNASSVSLYLDLSNNGNGAYVGIGERCLINGTSLTKSYYYGLDVISGQTPKNGSSTNSNYSIYKIVGYK